MTAEVQQRVRVVRRQRQRRKSRDARQGAQIDQVHFFGTEVGNRVRAVTGGEHERVGPRTARQDVRTAAAVQHVVAPTPIKIVVSRLAV